MIEKNHDLTEFTVGYKLIRLFMAHRV